MNKLEKYKMGKEYKPKYKLTIKYPRLPLKFESGDIVYYNALSKAYVREKFPHYAVDVNEVENNPDFWEKVKQPLFVTDDGFVLFGETNRKFYIVVDFIKYRSTISDFEDQKKLPHKVFYNESNADEYIAWYKKEFSINDLLLADVGITTSQLDKLQELAIERSEQ